MAETPRFDPSALTNAVADALTVRRVYGEPYEQGGVTVIPVARVWGATGTGAGGGEGQGEGGVPAAWLSARPGRGAWWSKAAEPAEGATDEGSATGPATDADAHDAEHGHEHGEHGHDHGHGHGYGQGHGGGGGFAVHVRAVGVYVIDDRGVHWRPSVDVNRVILGAQAVGAVAVTAVALTFAVKASSAAVAKGLVGLGAGIAAAFSRR